MARLVGPDPDSRNPFGLGKDAAGRLVDVFTDAECTELADIREFDPETPSTVGSAIDDSRVTLDSRGRLPLVWFPDAVNTLYARTVRGGRVQAVTATPAGPLRVFRGSEEDTSDLVSLMDEDGGLLFRIDSFGRIVSRGLAAGQTPAVAIGAGLGSSGNGAAVSVANASDVAGTLTITTASTGTGAGVLATLTFTEAFGAAAKAVFFPKTAASAALAAYSNTSTTTADLRTAATPAASTTYVFDYVIVG